MIETFQQTNDKIHVNFFFSFDDLNTSTACFYTFDFRSVWFPVFFFSLFHFCYCAIFLVKSNDHLSRLILFLSHFLMLS